MVRFSIPGIGIAGVGESRPLTGFITPVRRKSGGINTGVAIRNTGGATQTLRLTLRDRQGAMVAGGQATIGDFPASGHLARFIDQLFPTADASDLEGTLVVETSGGTIAATALELGTAAGQFTTLPVTPLENASPTGTPDQPETQGTEPVRAYFAQFGNGQGFTSTTVLTNPSPQVAITGAIEFFADAGLPLQVGIASGGNLDEFGLMGRVPAGGASRVEFSIPPLGSTTISTDGSGDLSAGSAVVTSDRRLGGVIRFSVPGVGIAGVGESQRQPRFIVPVQRHSAGINTGIAIQSGEDRSLTLTLSLRNTQGLEVQNGTATIVDFPARGHQAKFIDELFPLADTGNFQGTLVVEADGLIAGTALELGPSAGQFTTLPVTAVD